MRFLGLVLTFLVSLQLPAQAVDMDRLFDSPAMREICASTVAAHSKYPGIWQLQRPLFTLEGQDLYVSNQRNGEWIIARVEGTDNNRETEVARFNEPVRDLLVADQKLYVLLSESLVVLDLSSALPLAWIPTHDLDELPSMHYRAYSLAFVDGELAVAHGALGVLVLNSTTGRFDRTLPLNLRNQGNGHVSKAISIADAGDGSGIVAVQAVTVSNTPGSFAFNGLVKFSLSEAPVIASPYDYNTSGLLSHAYMYISDGTVYLNNSGFLHLVPVGAIDGSAVQVRYVPVVVDTEYKYTHTELMGDILVSGEALYGCSMMIYQEVVGGRGSRKGFPVSISL